MRPDWQTMQRLLCCLPGAGLEDQVAPALQALRQALPQTEIVLLANAVAANADVVDADVAIDVDLNVEWKLFNLTCDRSTPLATACLTQLIETVRHYSFDAAIIFTESDQSPYTMAYLCYLAAIPIRIGQSREFGGNVLSCCVTPPLDPVSAVNYHLHLVNAIDLCVSSNQSNAESNFQPSVLNHAVTNSHLACPR
ncbi:hypothetical protein [Leptolyngbya sp. 7M]|uniref:hypothetical protein n=1 Tax=Leptolyngbya sp. 7M TaxID=2812896 RepID=UPI001B8D5121|nr:hypothetical protein [Leptolyngbya sp. 7M]QYO67910.1 hypothetical protein JVX88_14690 [Leptolyngbya sp. 7M]